MQVLEVRGDRLADTGRFATAGAQAYTTDVAADGRFAAVANVGYVNGDADTVSVLDLRAEPFRTASVTAVPSTPEGLAISPDGRLLAVGSVDGSNLPDGHPRKRERSVLDLYRIGDDGSLTLLGRAPTGVNTQGVAFTPGGRRVAVQDFAGRRILFFGVDGDRLDPDPLAVPVPGQPAALRTAPAARPASAQIP